MLLFWGTCRGNQRLISTSNKEEKGCDFSILRKSSLLKWRLKFKWRNCPEWINFFYDSYSFRNKEQKKSQFMTLYERMIATSVESEANLRKFKKRVLFKEAFSFTWMLSDKTQNKGNRRSYKRKLILVMRAIYHVLSLHIFLYNDSFFKRKASTIVSKNIIVTWLE